MQLKTLNMFWAISSKNSNLISPNFVDITAISLSITDSLFSFVPQLTIAKHIVSKIMFLLSFYVPASGF